MHAERFTALLPVVEAAAKKAARGLTGEMRDDAVAEAIAAAYVMTAKCDELTTQVAIAAAVFGVRGYLAGRRTGSKARKNDAVFGRMTDVVSLDDAFAGDGRVTPADLAASRIDFAAWLDSLPARSREVAESLAAGFTTGEVAARCGISPPRVSQARRELRRNWDAFHGIG